MSKKRTRTHAVHVIDRSKENVIGVISSLQLLLKKRRPGVRAGQVFADKTRYRRARAKEELRPTSE